MKTSSAVTELRQFGLAYLVVGALTIALTATNDDRWRGNGDHVFTAVVAAIVGLAIVAHVAWTVRALRRPQLAPESTVILSWWATLCRRVLPSAAPTAALAVFLAVQGGSWLLGGAYMALGAVLVAEAVMTSRIERRRNMHVLRFQSRYFFAH
jgi:hypothetical protein